MLLDMKHEMSKTGRKKQMHELQALGVRIAAAGAGLWHDLQLDEQTCRALREYKQLQPKARTRQAQYIAKLLRKYDQDTLSSIFEIRAQAERRRAAVAARLPEYYRKLRSRELTVAELEQAMPQMDTIAVSALLAHLPVLDAKQAAELATPPREPYAAEVWQLLRQALPR